MRKTILRTLVIFAILLGIIFTGCASNNNDSYRSNSSSYFNISKIKKQCKEKGEGWKVKTYSDGSALCLNTKEEKKQNKDKQLNKCIKQKNKFNFTVKTLHNSRIRIMNIVPKYKDCIALKQGIYDIEVSKKGYRTYRRKINVDDDTTLTVNLNKLTSKEIKKYKKAKQAKIIANGNIIWDKTNYWKEFSKHKYYNLLVTNSHWSGSWDKANRHCRNSEINESGLKIRYLRLPTSSELCDLSYRYGKYAQFWTQKKPVMLTNGVSSGRTVGFLSYPCNQRYIGRSENQSFICVRNIKNIFRKQGLNQIAKQLLDNENKKIKKVNFPKKPLKKKYKKILKGEFETTLQYNQKVKKSHEMIDLENKNNLEQWKKNIKDIKSQQKSELAKFKKNMSKLYLKNLQKAYFYKYGNPKIGTVKYNADKQIFNIELLSNRGNYNKKVTLPVKLKYAKKFKTILTNKNFNPTVEFEVKNNKLIFRGIKEIKDPEQLVEENEYTKAYNTSGLHDRVSALERFISKYPKSTFKSSAQSKIANLKQEIKIKEEKEKIYREKRAKEEQERKERIAKARQRKQDSYYAKKRVGEKVCKDGTTAIFLSITITAYVERVNGNSIQLRISDTEGTSPNMNGVTLYRDTLIWDDYSSWYKCNY